MSHKQTPLNPKHISDVGQALSLHFQGYGFVFMAFPVTENKEIPEGPAEDAAYVSNCSRKIMIRVLQDVINNMKAGTDNVINPGPEPEQRAN